MINKNFPKRKAKGLDVYVKAFFGWKYGMAPPRNINSWALPGNVVILEDMIIQDATEEPPRGYEKVRGNILAYFDPKRTIESYFTKP